MEMIKIAILDDENEEIDLLKLYCLEFFSKHNFRLSIKTYDKTEQFLKSDYSEIDLLLLDIEMPNYSGIEIAHKVRSVNKKCFICFITNYIDYIFDSYDVHAFDYLMKPVEKKRLFKLFADVIKYQNSQKHLINKKIKFNTTNGELFIEQNKIMYFEYHDKFKDLFNRVIILHTIDKNYVLKEKIKDILLKVGMEIFVLPHKSFIINMDYIKQISKNEIIIQNNDVIPLSQKRAANVRKKFSQYIHLFYEEI